MKKINLIILLALFLNHTNLFGQNKSQIEIGFGIGTNSLNWSVFDTLNKTTTKNLRNKINIKPVIRLSFQKDLLMTKNFSIGVQPFLGYYTFGGSSKIESNGFQDRINLNSLELGIIPNIRIKKHFLVGIGIKGQYVLKANSKSFGTIDGGTNDSTIWQNYDMKGFFLKTPLNLGLNLKYVKDKYSVGIDYWYGISNLNKIIPKEFLPMIRESNFRLLFSYNLLQPRKNGKEDKK
jgi:hypothetical protein